MRVLACLRKTFLENLRDWKILILTLTLTPSLVYIMYGYLRAAPSSYTLLVVNQDRAAGVSPEAPGAAGLVAAWTLVPNTDGSPLFKVRPLDDAAAASLIKEVDKGTMVRLALSRLTTAELLTAVTLNQVLIGCVTALLPYGAAVSVGYSSQGSLAAMLVVAAFATVSVVAISVVVSAFMRTIFELLAVGCFPFFVLMFFSDAMVPLPKIALFHVAGNVVNLSDVLPTSLAVRALNRILNDGAGPGSVWFELTGIAILTAAYFAGGIVLFRRRHQRLG